MRRLTDNHQYNRGRKDLRNLPAPILGQYRSEPMFSDGRLQGDGGKGGAGTL
jgi:hypothetical protein